ncbi:P-loop containing nucleoside triphosphate hydrolase [Freshwater phage uvFW-CGR-AMD-COM-C403]|jgi:KaiC/GvpD/RAD55 family RecA-like ATPase|nr:P-loop containing nucleoside triphosphate hydrolase [Freshwater phage uvFW-CGR-AMD-COM-C403]
MRSLLQVVGVESPAGHQLPEILPQLTASQVVFRQAQLHLIAGQPGGGKTLLALWYAVTSKVPSLYISADSDSRTIATRAGAIIMNRDVADVERLMDTEASVLLEDALADGANHVRFAFDPAPSLQDIEEEIEAWIELHGSAPAAVYVDNLMNVASASDNEWTALRDAMSAFHYMAREYESAFIVLHHVSENEKMSKPNYPAPRKALMGKVAALPELVLSVALDSASNNYRVAVVKNRHGKADPTAETYVSLSAEASKMVLYNSPTELFRARTMSQWQ